MCAKEDRVIHTFDSKSKAQNKRFHVCRKAGLVCLCHCHCLYGTVPVSEHRGLVIPHTPHPSSADASVWVYERVCVCVCVCPQGISLVSDFPQGLVLKLNRNEDRSKMLCLDFIILIKYRHSCDMFVDVPCSGAIYTIYIVLLGFTIYCLGIRHIRTTV